MGHLEAHGRGEVDSGTEFQLTETPVAMRASLVVRCEGETTKNAGDESRHTIEDPREF